MLAVSMLFLLSINAMLFQVFVQTSVKRDPNLDTSSMYVSRISTHKSCRSRLRLLYVTPLLQLLALLFGLRSVIDAVVVIKLIEQRKQLYVHRYNPNVKTVLLYSLLPSSIP